MFWQQLNHGVGNQDDVWEAYEDHGDIAIVHTHHVETHFNNMKSSFKIVRNYGWCSDSI